MQKCRFHNLLDGPKTIDFDKIKDFYMQTLPQIGWQVSKNFQDKLSFTREKEKLEINFIKENDVDVVRFLISSEI